MRNVYADAAMKHNSFDFICLRFNEYMNERYSRETERGYEAYMVFKYPIFGECGSSRMPTYKYVLHLRPIINIGYNAS